MSEDYPVTLPELQQVMTSLKKIMDERSDDGTMAEDEKEREIDVSLDKNALESLSSVLAKVGGRDGLSTLPEEILHPILEPVRLSLEHLSAERLLDLERTASGARLCDGVNVRPIHGLVVPQYDTPCVRYIHISEKPDQYSIGIFVFPPFSKIPLHDHPGMCVLSRLLYGELQCLSMDLVRPDDTSSSNDDAIKKEHNPVKQKTSAWDFFRFQQPKQEQLPPQSRKAMKKNVVHLHAPSVTTLYPYEGNLHEFFAGPHGAAVLDILIPPYDAGMDRDCTFYDIVEDTSTQTPASKMDDDTKTPCWVYPRDQPEDFHCLSGRYGDLGRNACQTSHA